MKKYLIIGASILPSLAFAGGDGTVDLTNLNTAIRSLIGTVNLLIPFFVALAVLVFIYGLIKYVLSAGDAAARVEARGYIIYGVIGIAVMLSVFGLVNLVRNTFGLDNTITGDDIPIVPCQTNDTTC